MTDPDLPPDAPRENHWGTLRPQEEQPPQDLIKGVPRLVQEARMTLGESATPEAVLADLQARGLDVTLDEVRADFGR